jgi:hypothetical protein
VRWIEIRYKCACLKEEVGFQMRERMADEDLRDYIDRLQQAITVDHNNRSPLCVRDKMEYAKLPISSDRIGGGVGGMG